MKYTYFFALYARLYKQTVPRLNFSIKFNNHQSNFCKMKDPLFFLKYLLKVSNSSSKSYVFLGLPVDKFLIIMLRMDYGRIPPARQQWKKNLLLFSLFMKYLVLPIFNYFPISFLFPLSCSCLKHKTVVNVYLFFIIIYIYL